jgi:hypothetical protein
MDVTSTVEQVQTYGIAVFDPGDIVEVRRLPSKRSTWLLAAELHLYVEELLRDNERGENIYVGANPRSRRGAKGDINVPLARCLFVDFDNTSVSEAIERCLAAKLPTPTLIIDSGHGAHVYWRLENPVSDMGAFRSHLLHMIKLLGTDSNVQNPERVMRLPGFINRKREPVPCKIISYNHETLISVEELMEAVSKAEAQKQGNSKPAGKTLDKVGRCLLCLAKAKDSVSGEGGHNAALAAACTCFRFGLSMDEAKQVMQQFNETKAFPKWSDKEIEHKLRDGYQKVIDAGEFGRELDRKKKAGTATAERHSKYVLIPGPHITDEGEYIEQGNNMFGQQVIDRLPPDVIYRKNYIPGEIIGRAGSRQWMEYVDTSVMCMTDAYVKLGKWIKPRSGGDPSILYTPTTRTLAGIIIAEARRHPKVRDLNLMTNYPIYTKSWIRCRAGWQEGIYYDEPEDLRGIEPITDCETIYNTLHDLVIDFPFKTQADRENFFGLLLTPIVAPALNGNRPLHLLLAPVERTGKTKLAEEVFGGVILGRQTPAMQITERDEERDKRIIGLLLQGESIVHLDNLPPFVDSGTLSSLVTATTYAGRLLGGNRMVNLPNNLTMVASGNNVQATGEIVKRVVPIVLQPRTASPEARADFHHSDLRSFVREQRTTVLQCLLGLVENWIAANRPKHQMRMGGFESWSETIGGILEVNGLRAWRTNEADWRKQADPRGAEMHDFVRSWWERFGDTEQAPRALIEHAKEKEMFEQVTGKHSAAAVASAFGKLLQRHVDAPIGEWFIRCEAGRTGKLYHLEMISDDTC